VHRYAYKVFYDGTKPFYGSQMQSTVRTVEGELLRALTRTGALPSDVDAVRFAFAGRTDRFVSALGNVFAVNLASNTTPAAINSRLKSDDIRVWASARVQDLFNPRQALKRHYKYFAYNFEGIDLERLVEVSKLFLGVHDFRHFAHRLSNKNSVRKISELTVVSSPDHFICFDIVGDSFLRRMVRRIVGSLIYVARGILKETEIRKLLDPSSSVVPRMGIPSAPPEGLVLWDVDYGFPFIVDDYAAKKLQESLMKSLTSLVIKKAIMNRFVEPNNGSNWEQSGGSCSAYDDLK
jgi:tRNA pseudouridine38-40 synthase